MDTKGGKLQWGGNGGVLNWAIGIDMYTLMCIKLITNKNLQYKKTNKQNKQTKKVNKQTPELTGHLLFFFNPKADNITGLSIVNLASPLIKSCVLIFP